MTRALHELDDHELGDALRELGSRLGVDLGTSVDGDATLTTAVLDRLPGTTIEGIQGADAPTGMQLRRGRSPRFLLVAAAVALVLGLAVLTYTPSREAVARWFGVDGVQISRTDQLPTGAPGPRPERPLDPGGKIPDLDALADQLPFSFRLPSELLAGPAVSAQVDPAVSTGLIEIRYRGFTLVALAARSGEMPVLSKDLGPSTSVEAVVVQGAPGLWLTGAPHRLSFLDPAGEVVHDSVRQAGDVLLWNVSGVTYRVEGLTSLDAALEIAASLR